MGRNLPETSPQTVARPVSLRVVGGPLGEFKEYEGHNQLHDEYQRQAEAKLPVECLVVPQPHAQPRSCTAARRSYQQQGALCNAPPTATGAPLVYAEEAEGQCVERKQEGP